MFIALYATAVFSLIVAVLYAEVRWASYRYPGDNRNALERVVDRWDEWQYRKVYGTEAAQ